MTLTGGKPLFAVSMLPRHLVMDHRPVKAHIDVFPTAITTLGLTSSISLLRSAIPSTICRVTQRSPTWVCSAVRAFLDLANQREMSLLGGRSRATLVQN